MARLRTLSSHTSKVLLALRILSEGRKPGEPLPVSTAWLSDAVGLQERIVRLSLRELVSQGGIEVVSRGTIRLLNPGDWFDKENALPTVGKYDRSRVPNGETRKGGAGVSPKVKNSSSFGGVDQAGMQTSASRAVQERNSRERSLMLLAWGAQRLGLRTHPGTQYGKNVLVVLKRRIREGYTDIELKKAVETAAAHRQAGDRWALFTSLPWIWGRGIDTLLAPKASRPTDAGIDEATRQEMEATFLRRSGRQPTPDSQK